MKDLVKQNELIDEQSTQDKQTDTFQTFDRDLTAPLEDVLEQSIERVHPEVVSERVDKKPQEW